MDKEKRAKARDKIGRLWLAWLHLDEEDLPQVLKLIGAYSHMEACRPFVVVDLKNGVARSVIIDRYCLKDHELRRIGIDAGFYKPKRF